MSTYYDIICDKHRERCDAASRGAAGGIGPVADAPTTIWSFLYAHAGCNLRVVSEHEDEYGDPSYQDWTESNYRQLIDIDRS